MFICLLSKRDRARPRLVHVPLEPQFYGKLGTSTGRSREIDLIEAGLARNSPKFAIAYPGNSFQDRALTRALIASNNDLGQPEVLLSLHLFVGPR